MRSFVTIIVVLLLLSCSARKVETVSVPVLDTEKFVYSFSEGLRFKMIGQLDKAEEKYLYCLSIFPSSTATAYELANIYIEKGRPELAKLYSDICLKQKPENEWYIVQSVQVAKLLDRKSDCLPLYEKLVSLKPGNLNWIYDYAVLLFELKKYDLALIQLQKIEDESGINESISFLKNNIYFGMNRLDAIQLELLKLKKAFPDSSKYSDMLAELYLNSNQKFKALEIYLSLSNDTIYSQFANAGIAWIYGTTNECKRGYTYLIKVLNDPAFDKSKKLRIAEVYLTKECELTNDTLVKLYERLINIFPEKMEITNGYLQLLFGLKNYSKVEEIAKNATTNNPENFTSWDYLFNAYSVKAKYDELKGAAKKAQEYFPNHATVYFFEGYANFYLKNYNEAVKSLETGKEYIIDNNELLKQFYLYLAESYHSLSKFKLSDDYFDKYLEIDFLNAYVLNNYAYYLAIRKVDLKKAFTMSGKSIEIEPFNSVFLDTYSFILFLMGDTDKALSFIERAYKYGGNTNPLIVEHYGDILLAKNRTDEALEKWKEAYSLSRNNKLLLDKINKTEVGN